MYSLHSIQDWTSDSVWNPPYLVTPRILCTFHRHDECDVYMVSIVYIMLSWALLTHFFCSFNGGAHEVIYMTSLHVSPFLSPKVIQPGELIVRLFILRARGARLVSRVPVVRFMYSWSFSCTRQLRRVLHVSIRLSRFCTVEGSVSWKCRYIRLTR